MALHRSVTRRGARAVQAAARPADAGSPALIGLVAVLTLLTLELIRFSGPLLDSTYSRGGAPLVALVAVLTYAAPGPATALLLAGTRRAAQPWPVLLLAGSIALGSLRLVVQGLWGEARVAVGLLTVAVAVAVLVLAVSVLAGRPGGGRLTAGAVLTGAAGSVGLQLALGTWDAPWRSTTLGWSVTAAVVALVVLLAALAGRESTAEPNPVRGRWALGPVLALTALMLANPAFAAAQSGLPLAVAGPLLGLGLLLGAGLTMHRFGRTVARSRLLALPAAVLVVSTAVTLQITGTSLLRSALVLTALAAAQLSTAVLLSRACWSPTGAFRRSTAGTASLVGLATIVPLLLFQLDYDVRLGFPNALVLVGTAAALAVGGLRGERQASPNESAQRRGEGQPLLAAVVLVVAGTAVVLSGWLQDRSVQDGTYTGRVVSWNLHYGVSPEGVVDLEAVARVIEAQDPDVVLLQEVSRGWIQGGGADMATWLSQRLNRSFVFAPAADGRFGNVILARGTMTDVRVQSLPYGAGPQRRSALTALTRLGSRPMTVTSIHLQNRRQNAPTRITQLETFFAADGRSTEVLGGDLNATPGSTEVELLSGAGYVSAIDVAGDPAVLTAPSTAPTRRIDWVLGRGVSFAQAEVLTDVVLSDHLPLVVVVRP